MAKKDKDKIECQYCGNEYSKAGITNHEKACSANPDNKVEEVVLEPEIIIEPEVINEVVEEVKKEEINQPKMYDIKLADKVECYIGDRYYRFKKGEEAEVTLNVKDILKKAGLLEAI